MSERSQVGLLEMPLPEVHRPLCYSVRFPIQVCFFSRPCVCLFSQRAFIAVNGISPYAPYDSDLDHYKYFRTRLGSIAGMQYIDATYFYRCRT